MDGILKLFAEYPLTRVPRYLEKEKAGVRLREIVIWGRVFVKYLEAHLYTIVLLR